MQEESTLSIHFPGGKRPLILSPSDGKTEWSFGRSPTNDIEMIEGWVSGQHCFIRYKADDRTWQIQDDISSNGTWLNGDRIPPKAWMNLVDDDRLEFGDPKKFQGLTLWIAYNNATIEVDYSTEETVGESINQPATDLKVIVMRAIWDGPIQNPSPRFLAFWRFAICVFLAVLIVMFAPAIIEGLLE